MAKHIIFLHGLHSSPASQKCQALRVYLENDPLDVTFSAPQLSYDPDQNWQKLQSVLAGLGVDVAAATPARWAESKAGAAAAREVARPYPTNDAVALIGSSMGGFYAGCLSQRYGMRAALINPVVEPLALLHRVQGQQTHPATGEVYTFSAADQQKFERWGILNPNEAAAGHTRAVDRMLLCLALKDETVDPALALARFQQARRIIDPTGGHQFPRFVTALPEILAFLFPEAPV